MPVRFDDPRPPYEQLATELRGAIAAGHYEPGDRLPSTRQLAEANGIAAMTVQHALRVLRDEGVVVSQPGRGVYVQEPADRGTDAAVDAPDADATDVPTTLDEAIAMITDLRDRLDRLEAGAAQAEPGPENATIAEPSNRPGIDLD